MRKKKKYNYEVASEEDLKAIAGASPSAGIDPNVDEIPTPESFKSVAEGVADAGATVAQSASLETADDILESIAGKDIADKYRAEIAKRRQRSPVATTISDLVAPNPLSKLKMMHKVGKKIPSVVEDIASGAVITEASGGDFGEKEAYLSAGSGMALRGLPRLFGDYQKSRAAHMNLGDITRFDKKAKSLSKKGEFTDVEAYARQLMDRYDKDYGLFTSGKASFDPETMKFSSTDKVRGGTLGKAIKKSVTAPSRRELNQRVIEASDRVAERLNQRIDSLSPDMTGQSSFFHEAPQTINEAQFNAFNSHMFADIVGESKALDPRVKKEIQNTIDMVRDELFGPRRPQMKVNEDTIFRETVEELNMKNQPLDENYIEKSTRDRVQDLNFGAGQREGIATIKDLNEVKRKIYAMVEGEYERLNVSTPSKEALQRTAFGIKNMINELSGDPEIAKMNQFLEDMYSVREGLGKAVAGQFAEKSTTGIKPYGSTAYKAGSFLEKQADKFMTPISQMSAEVQQNPELKSQLSGISSAAVPRLLNRGADSRAEDPVYRSPDMVSAGMNNLPTQLMQVKIPRTVEGIQDNKDLVLMKVAQEMPIEFPQVQAMMESGVDINDALPMLIQLLPHMFEKDRYNRIDNILPDDMKEMAIEEVRKDGKLSNTERINKINNINLTGEFYDD